MPKGVECCHDARVLLPDTLKIAGSPEAFVLMTPFASLRAAEWRADRADTVQSLPPVPPDVWTFTEKVLQKSLGTHAPPIVA